MLHEILSERRRSLGMSIDQLVEKSGVPKGTLTKVLTGISPNPALETIKAISYALGLTLNDLVEPSTGLSEAAMRLAALYDELDENGKELLNIVADLQVKRMKETTAQKSKRVPHYDTSYQGGRVETKHAAMMEQRELSKDDLSPELANFSYEPFLNTEPEGKLLREELEEEA